MSSSQHSRFGCDEQSVRLAATYQNHAGDKYVGSALWDLHYLIHDLDPSLMGSQYDLRHATAEGGTTWTLSLRLLSELINTWPLRTSSGPKMPRDGELRMSR